MTDKNKLILIGYSAS